ncbi:MULTISPECIES: hypothetical protein [Actinomycetes]|uniref:hypothetical protein n=1 Tax=Micromonospora sp. NPDC005367 TaxID=3155590 RepID=UPI0033BF1017
MTHTCRNGHRCRQAIRTTDGERLGALTENGGLCKACETAAFNAIVHLADDWEALNDTASQPFSTGNPAPRVSRTPDRHRAPVRVDALDLARRIDEETGRWAWRVTRTRPQSMPRNAQERVSRNVAALTRYLGTLADLPAQGVGLPTIRDDGSVGWATITLTGADALIRLERLHRAANRLLGVGGVVTWLRDPCHMCGRRTLTSDPEEGRVACAHCDHSWASDEFDRFNPLGTTA